jgi:Na+-transporting NADH:ubiquinone oxidoreductase subunit NqrC
VEGVAIKDSASSLSSKKQEAIDSDSEKAVEKKAELLASMMEARTISAIYNEAIDELIAKSKESGFFEKLEADKKGKIEVLKKEDI